jgi:hypothetical protein
MSLQYSTNLKHFKLAMLGIRFLKFSKDSLKTQRTKFGKS